MIKIEDERRLLNLDHTVIFLMLSPEENLQYGEKLRTLNRYATLTRGLFRFDIVERGESPYEQLSDSLKRATRDCNVMIRLINSISGIYCYGLEYVDLRADIKTLVSELKVFVEDVCCTDMRQLEILAPRTTTMSVKAKAYYKAHWLFEDVFNSALKLTTDDLAKARQAIEQASLSNNAKTSHDMMAGAVNSKLADRLEKERCEMEAPDEQPEIFIGIKLDVDTGKRTRGGKVKTGLGIEVTINGETPIPIYFGARHVTFLYLALLLGIKEDHHVRRRDFVNGKDRPKTQEWLREKFRLFAFDTTFDVFIATANEHGPAALINDAKSKVNKALWAILSDQYKDAYHYLCINTVEQRANSSRYEVRLTPGQIRLDPRLADRAARFVNARA